MIITNVGVIPPTESIGSLGDQILLKGFVDSNPLPCTKYTLLISNNKSEWNFLSNYSYSYKNINENDFNFDIIFAIGADCIDGKYSTLFLEKILFLNRKYPTIPIRVISCSYNKTPTTRSMDIINLLSDNVSFYLRDIISKSRFDLRFNKKTFLMSDLGFALKEAKIEIEIPENRLLLNLNNMNKLGDKYLEKYIHFFREKEVLLLEHDFRLGHGEREYLTKLKNSIKLSNYIIEKDVSILKNYYNKIDYSISARLHVCIMSLLSGKCAIGLNYQDKMEGIFFDFNIEELVCNTPNELEEKVKYLESKKTKLEEKISSKLVEIKNRISIIWT